MCCVCVCVCVCVWCHPPQVLKRVAANDKTGELQKQGRELAESHVSASLLDRERLAIIDKHAALEKQHADLQVCRGTAMCL